MKVGDRVRVVEHADHEYSPEPYDEIGDSGVVEEYINSELVFVVLDGRHYPFAYAESQLEVVKE